MATKTFEELKQLAIQIRDEKTNKQNTATRVGTAMLEHINKLEQDYYDKTTINNRTSEYNVSINHPTSGISSSNKYDLSSAIAQVPAELRTSGLTVSFLNESGDTEKWEFGGGSWAVGGFSQVGARRIIELIENTDGITYIDIRKDKNMTGGLIIGGASVHIVIKNTGKIRATIFFVAKKDGQRLSTLSEFGYQGIDPQQTLEFEAILPGDTNSIIVDETQAVDCTYTVVIMSKNSIINRVYTNTKNIENNTENINKNTNSISILNKLAESFNKLNPEELLLEKTVNPDNGAIVQFSNRMVYVLKLSSPALSTDTITTNAYGCALMKSGAWIAKIDPIGGTIPKNLTEGTDEIRLYFLDKNTANKFIYINSDISKYIPYGKTLTDYKIETNTKNIETNTKNIETNTKNIEKLQSGGSGSSHPMTGSEFTAVGDSLCASNKWQTKLAELTKAINVVGYSTGGTKTYGYKEDCGQRRLIKLHSEHPNIPYIFLENINDMEKAMEYSNNIGDYQTDIPFMYETHSIDGNVQNSYEEAISYWDSNFDTFASSVSPQTGYIRVLKHKKAAFQLNVQGKATSDGAFNIVIGEDSYGIAVTTEMTIDDICDAILNYSFTGFTDTAVGSSNNYTGVKLTGDNSVSSDTSVSVEENGTGINIQIENVSSEAEILYYFNSLDVSSFTNKSKWKIEKEMTLASFYMGILQYVVTNFPTAKIYWMIMPRFGINFSSLDPYYKWENSVINTARFKGTATEKAIKILNDFQKEICDWYLIPYLDVERYWGVNYYNASYYYPNGDVHPKEVGYDRWAETIYRLTYGL